MVDTVAITAGSGTAIAADDIGSVFYQRVKLTLGADGAADADWDLGQQLSAASAPVVIASDQSVVPVVPSATVITVTPTVDTAVYASGDLLFDSVEVASAVRANAGIAVLDSVTVIDDGDQGVAFTLLIANAATDFGTINDAPNPDDDEVATVIGHVAIGTADYVDLGGARVACVKNIGLVLKAGAATTSLYIAGVNGTGTPDYVAADDLHFYLGFLRS